MVCCFHGFLALIHCLSPKRLTSHILLVVPIHLHLFWYHYWSYSLFAEWYLFVICLLFVPADGRIGVDLWEHFIKFLEWEAEDLIFITWSFSLMTGIYLFQSLLLKLWDVFPHPDPLLSLLSYKFSTSIFINFANYIALQNVFYAEHLFESYLVIFF